MLIVFFSSSLLIFSHEIRIQKSIDLSDTVFFNIFIAVCKMEIENPIEDERKVFFSLII